MIMRRGKIRAFKTALMAVFLVLGLSTPSQAGPLGVPLDPYPVILASFITSTYSATTGAFSATGWAMTVDTGTGQQNITTPFKLFATITNSGVATGGSLLVGSAASPLLSTTTLTGFAFNAVQGGTLEFLFGTISGAYVPDVYSATKPLDVMLTVGNTFLGTFATSWMSSSNTAQLREDPPADAVPEPASLLVLLAGAGGLYRQARKRKQNKTTL